MQTKINTYKQKIVVEKFTNIKINNRNKIKINKKID